MSKSKLEGQFRLAWLTLGREAGVPAEGLPAYEAEYEFHPVRGWAFDFAWPEHQVAVEIDGGQWSPHGGRHSRDGDREKLNAAAVLGWRVLRYSGTMLRDPESVISEVLDALRRRER